MRTILYRPDGTYPEFAQCDIRVSRLNRFGFLRADHRRALPLLAATVDSHPIDADVLVVSSSGWAHGFPTRGRRLVYCHTPARYLYLPDDYLGQSKPWSASRLALGAVRRPLIRWDQARAKRAAASGLYLANSTMVRERIRAVYGFDAEYLPPPFSPDLALPGEPVDELVDWQDDGFHLVVSRLMPYKNVDAVLDAFAMMPDRRLVVVGRGPERERLLARAPANARLVQDLSDAQLRWVYQHALALVAASREDFGLTPLEAGSYGKPTIALQAGGYLDSIAPDVSGLFFSAPAPDLIAAAVEQAGQRSWSSTAIQDHVAGFAEPTFINAIHDHVRRLTYC